jgi:hypothetical protein
MKERSCKKKMSYAQSVCKEFPQHDCQVAATKYGLCEWKSGQCRPKRYSRTGRTPAVVINEWSRKLKPTHKYYDPKGENYLRTLAQLETFLRESGIEPKIQEYKRGGKIDWNRILEVKVQLGQEGNPGKLLWKDTHTPHTDSHSYIDPELALHTPIRQPTRQHETLSSEEQEHLATTFKRMGLKWPPS